ncbi:hypothetical protein BpHYR1_014590 [Brachionus plicatilis]|uniref:Uncharacterized protein n=1 Tax=Brachionus plicatilis TaxID=10195 RepID=A0A3M7PVP3_BRAPC|nr:hypothetical protein BpHYR1_014590 [Brachionus plicatilis]
MNNSAPNMNGRFKINGNFANTKRKFFTENINNIEIEIIKRNYFNNLHNSCSTYHHFDFKPQDFNQSKNSNFDYSRLSRPDPQPLPLFSQNVNYNVPKKKFFINNEQNPVKYSKRRNQYNRPKNDVKKNETFNDIFKDYRLSRPVNENQAQIELEHINPNKTASTQPVGIDENLIKHDLHKTQTNKRPGSLYENFIKSATKKETKVEKLDTLEINLSSLSLSSNETTSVNSKENFKSVCSNLFENNSGLKKSDSFGNKSSKDGSLDGKISFSQNLRLNERETGEKKKSKRRNKWRKDTKKSESNDEFDFSTTNEFWEDEDHLVIGHDYLNFDSDVDFNIDFDLDN